MLSLTSEVIESIDFSNPKQKNTPRLEKNPVAEKKIKSHILKIERQLKEYFDGKRQSFNLDLAPSRGTDFQKRVWKALDRIPYGQTWSYADVANKVGSPKAVRAVGGANNRNPLAIVVPCHRVIGKNGSLVGYGGGLNVKTKLLKLEGVL